jgi:hypothetical protein
MSFRLRLTIFRFTVKYALKGLGGDLSMLAVACGMLVCPTLTARWCEKRTEKTR